MSLVWSAPWPLACGTELIANEFPGGTELANEFPDDEAPPEAHVHCLGVAGDVLWHADRLLELKTERPHASDEQLLSIQVDLHPRLACGLREVPLDAQPPNDVACHAAAARPSHRW